MSVVIDLVALDVGDFEIGHVYERHAAGVKAEQKEVASPFELGVVFEVDNL